MNIGNIFSLLIMYLNSLQVNYFYSEPAESISILLNSRFFYDMKNISFNSQKNGPPSLKLWRTGPHSR
jgi:hypothetical protein